MEWVPEWVPWTLRTEVHRHLAFSTLCFVKEQIQNMLYAEHGLCANTLKN